MQRKQADKKKRPKLQKSLFVALFPLYFLLKLKLETQDQWCVTQNEEEEGHHTFFFFPMFTYLFWVGIRTWKMKCKNDKESNDFDLSIKHQWWKQERGSIYLDDGHFG